VSLRSFVIFREANQLCAVSVVPPVFHPEYGRYMLESTPGVPYTGSVRDLVLVEFNMRLRYVTARTSPDSLERRQ